MFALDRLFESWFGGSDSVRVTNASILSSAAVWYAMNTISGDVGKMPLEVMQTQRDGRGATPYTSHPAYRLCRDESNMYQTANVFREQLQGHALGWGNGRAYIVRQGLTPVELLPMLPDRTWTVMIAGEKFHLVHPYYSWLQDDPMQTIAELQREMQRESGNALPPGWAVFPDRDVLHIPGFSYNGWSGLNIADVARDSLGIDLQAQRYTNKGLNKGFSGQIMLEAPVNMFPKEDDARRFINMFREQYTNAKDAEAVGLLREGMTAKVMNMSSRDAQFIETRQFQRQDVMLWFGLQHIPGDDSSVSYNSLDQKQRSYLASCLDRWLVRWENECDAKLRTPGEKRAGNVFFKFNRATWLATDTATTQAVLSGYVQSEIMTANEAREVIELNPVEGGDMLRNPAINPTPEEMPEPQSRLDHMIGVECKRLNAAAKLGRKEFAAWVDGFYQKWEPKLIEAIDDEETAKQTMLEHQTDVLEAMASSKNANQLRDNIRELTDRWQDGS